MGFEKVCSGLGFNDHTILFFFYFAYSGLFRPSLLCALANWPLAKADRVESSMASANEAIISANR